MLPIFSLFLSLWGHSHSRVNGQGAGGDLPIRLFPLSALGLPCLCSGGGGQRRQCLAGPSVLRDGCLVPVQDSSLPLLRYPVSLRPGLGSIHFFQFNSIPVRRKIRISQFQFNSIHLKEINVQFQFNSIHKLFNSNSNPIPYHHYFIRVALLKFHSTQLI